MDLKEKIEICKKCNEFLTEYVNTDFLEEKKCIVNKIEKFLIDSYMELKDVQEYKAVFLKYIYIKEIINSNE